MKKQKTLKFHTLGGVVEGKYISHDHTFVTVEVTESSNKKMVGRIEKLNRDEMVPEIGKRGGFEPDVDHAEFGQSMFPGDKLPDFEHTPPPPTKENGYNNQFGVGPEKAKEIEEIMAKPTNSSIIWKLIGWSVLLSIAPVFFMAIAKMMEMTIGDGFCVGMGVDLVIVWVYYLIKFLKWTR